MRRKKRKRGFKSINFLALFIIIYILAVFWNQRNLTKELQSKKNENILVNKELEKEIESLEKQIEDSQTLQFVERIARDELGMVKPKEIIVIDRSKNSKPFFKNIRKDN